MDADKTLYSSRYVETQAYKFDHRYEIHWKHHIQIAKDLMKTFGPKPPALILDLGCSIGTYAIEFALEGYSTIGLDYDSESLAVAAVKAEEVGCKPQWICNDAQNFDLQKKVDAIVCFDLFEHLVDPVLENTIRVVADNLNQGGVIVFHTFPTKYDHIFYGNNLLCIPLVPFYFVPASLFDRIVKIYSHFIDVLYVLRYFKTHKQLIQKTVHPNPLDYNRLKDLLEENNFVIQEYETGIDQFNPLRKFQGYIAKRFFSNQPVAHRSVWGVAKKL